MNKFIQGVVIYIFSSLNARYLALNLLAYLRGQDMFQGNDYIIYKDMVEQA